MPAKSPSSGTSWNAARPDLPSSTAPVLRRAPLPALFGNRLRTQPSKPSVGYLILSSFVTGFHLFLLAWIGTMIVTGRLVEPPTGFWLLLLGLILLGITITERVGNRLYRGIACSLILLINAPAALLYFGLMAQSSLVSVVFLIATLTAMAMAVHHARKMTRFEHGGRLQPRPPRPPPPEDEFETNGAWDEAKPDRHHA